MKFINNILQAVRDRKNATKQPEQLREFALEKIEEVCVIYNEMIEDYINMFPEHGAEDIMKMLRRVHQRGCNKTTGEADK